MVDGPSAAPAVANAFRAAEKAYKRDGKQPNRGLTPAQECKLIDFDQASGDERVEVMPVAHGAPDWLRAARIYSVRGVDGFRFVRCPFDTDAQLQLVRSALCEWIEPPSANNLATAHGVSNAAAADASQLWARHVDAPTDSLLSRLTWATVGYQYQWTPRTYDPACRSPFPAALATLAAELAAACGWRLRPEAAILNLYHAASTMGGHRDDAEPCQEVPIVSLSLGLDCVYLLGGATKAEVPRAAFSSHVPHSRRRSPATASLTRRSAVLASQAPLAMRLRSGDVVVQGGASRGFVHGVPRVLPHTLPPALCADALPPHARDALAPFSHWLATHRLNINVRQVYGADGPPAVTGEGAAPDARTGANGGGMTDGDDDGAPRERVKRLRDDGGEAGDGPEP